MTYKHINALLFASLIVIILPLRMSAQGVNPETDKAPLGTCSAVLSNLSTLVHPLITSTSVRAGEPVVVPLSLQNDTGTPLLNVRLILKVTKLGKSPRLVLLQMEKKRYSLFAGELATTSIAWNTLRTEATGDYRIDIFPVPSEQYINPRLALDVSSRANVRIHLSAGRSDTVLSFVPDGTLINGAKYNPLFPVRFDEHEGGVMSIMVHNSGKETLPVLVNWKVFPYQQIDEDTLLLATSSSVVVSPGKSQLVDLPIPLSPSMRYFAVAEVADGGQYTLLPISFNRSVIGPVPVSIFGVMQDGEQRGPFDFREKEQYTVFACPMGLSVLAPTTISLEVQDEFGKRVLASSTVNNVGEAALPLEFSFIPATNMPNAKLIMTRSAAGVVERSTMPVSCGKEHGGICRSLGAAPEPADQTSLLVIIGAIIIFAGGSISWGRRHKHSHHEKITHK